MRTKRCKHDVVDAVVVVVVALKLQKSIFEFFFGLVLPPKDNKTILGHSLNWRKRGHEYV